MTTGNDDSAMDEFQREIDELVESAEHFFDSIGRRVTAEHVDRAIGYAQVAEDIERRTASAGASSQCSDPALARIAKIRTNIRTMIDFGLAMTEPVAFDRDFAILRVEINHLIEAVGFVRDAIVAVAAARGFTLRLDAEPDNGTLRSEGMSLVHGVFARNGIERAAPIYGLIDPRLKDFP
jgi:hypothetical protein